METTHAARGDSVLAFSGYQFTIDPIHDLSIKYVVPIVVAGPSAFNLLAVWTKEDDEKKAMYIGQALAGANAYTSFIGGGPTVVVGDFNSNLMWDSPTTIAMQMLWLPWRATVWLASIITWYQERQGTETRNTFYMYRALTAAFTSTTASFHAVGCHMCAVFGVGADEAGRSGSRATIAHWS